MSEMVSREDTEAQLAWAERVVAEGPQGCTRASKQELLPFLRTVFALYDRIDTLEAENATLHAERDALEQERDRLKAFARKCFVEGDHRLSQMAKAALRSEEEAK